MGADSPDVVIAKKLIDHAKLAGFTFQRTAADQDAPLIGKRAGGNWIDIIHIAGFSRDCLATRQRTSSLTGDSDDRYGFQKQYLSINHYSNVLVGLVGYLEAGRPDTELAMQVKAPRSHHEICDFVEKFTRFAFGQYQDAAALVAARLTR